VVPVYKVEKIKFDEGSYQYKLCFTDNHGSGKEHDSCGKNLIITPEGLVHYENWETLIDEYGFPTYMFDHAPGNSNIRWAGFTPEDKFENVQFVKQQAKMCRKMTGCR
ncbi:MAG: hypothetical protein ACOCUH_01410, partial [Bacteriovoracia bacterium]